MARWSDLPPVDLEIELAKLGLTVDDLVQDGEDDPELGPVMERLESDEAKQRLAVEWYGDQRGPQPKERKRRHYFFGITEAGPEHFVYHDPTPDWGRLPPREDDQPTAEEQLKLDERAERWRIPYDSFWYILEQRVKRGKLAKVSTLAERTRRSRRLTFVGRTRVAHVVAWIEAHPEQAERALTLHEIPAGFRANEDGVLVPKPPNPASRHASR